MFIFWISEALGIPGIFFSAKFGKIKNRYNLIYIHSIRFKIQLKYHVGGVYIMSNHWPNVSQTQFEHVKRRCVQVNGRTLPFTRCEKTFITKIYTQQSSRTKIFFSRKSPLTVPLSGQYTLHTIRSTFFLTLVIDLISWIEVLFTKKSNCILVKLKTKVAHTVRHRAHRIAWNWTISDEYY